MISGGLGRISLTIGTFAKNSTLPLRAASHSLQLRIVELLTCLIPHPICFANVKSRLHNQGYGGIRVCSALKLSPQTSIILKSCKKGCELLF